MFNISNNVYIGFNLFQYKRYNIVDSNMYISKCGEDLRKYHMEIFKENNLYNSNSNYYNSNNNLYNSNSNLYNNIYNINILNNSNLCLYSNNYFIIKCDIFYNSTLFIKIYAIVYDKKYTKYIDIDYIEINDNIHIKYNKDNKSIIYNNILNNSNNILNNSNNNILNNSNNILNNSNNNILYNSNEIIFYMYEEYNIFIKILLEYNNINNSNTNNILYDNNTINNLYFCYNKLYNYVYDNNNDNNDNKFVSIDDLNDLDKNINIIEIYNKLNKK
ncbi:hypothetical protein EHP00_2430 [Ecytonucleospora hepatopenaei]|uniref:Uncharacterized protein n=1 Tax=Ecytonucleospora hepatopenaei TaxID=646526 RepID=A0A1W0E657_9MICR|nr:hypothetical protein EHP00_2430 [Ecytonucleospora hepatopenaei]